MNKKELQQLTSSVQIERINEAFDAIKAFKKHYPTELINNICKNLKISEREAELVAVFSLGQVYQTKNSKVLELFVNDLIAQFTNSYEQAKECADDVNAPYIDGMYEGAADAYSDVIYTLRKKLSEFG